MDEYCSFLNYNLDLALKYHYSCIYIQVDLTWDETDRSRLNVLTKKFTDAELADMDMKDFLASSSSEEEEDEEQNGYSGDLGM